MPRDLSAATEAGAQASKGYSHAYLAELYFDSVVTSSRIEWETSPPGNRASVIVEVSLDGGRSFVRATNGATIPGLAAGALSHGKSIIARQFFLGELADTNGNTYQQAALDWIEVEVNFDTGEQILRREDSQTEFLGGSLFGTEVSSDGLVRVELEHVLEFTGIGGYVRIPGGLDSPINLSRGKSINFNGFIFEIGAPWPGAVATDAAFGLQFLVDIKNTATRQTIAQWTTYERHLPGVELYIEDGKICVDIPELRGTSDGTTVKVAHNFVKTPRILKPYAGRPSAIDLSYDGIRLTIWSDQQVVATHRVQTDFRGGSATFVSSVVATMSGDLHLGADREGLHPLEGNIREVRLWKGLLTHGDVVRWADRPLSVAEVDALSPEAYDRLRAYYRCDDGVGSTLTDTAGTNHGTLIQPAAADAGVRWVTARSGRGGYTAEDSFAPYRDSPPLPVATYGNRVNVSTLPSNYRYADVEYLGVGTLGAISQIDETAELESRGLTLTLSGVQLAHLSIAQQTPYRDRPCRVLLVIFGDDGRIKGEPVVLFEGLMDTMPISVGDTATVSVTCESHMVRWEEVRARRWTSASQRELYPGDAGLDLLAATAEKTIWWPAKFTPDKKDGA